MLSCSSGYFETYHDFDEEHKYRCELERGFHVRDVPQNPRLETFDSKSGTKTVSEVMILWDTWTCLWQVS